MPLITIDFAHPDVVAPVFVAATFTNWETIELDFVVASTERGWQYTFSKSFFVSPGSHQYKFRLGHGDWWVCKESEPRGLDPAGNENNILLVGAEMAHNQSMESSPEVDQEEFAHAGLISRQPEQAVSAAPPVDADSSTAENNEQHGEPCARGQGIAINLTHSVSMADRQLAYSKGETSNHNLPHTNRSRSIWSTDGACDSEDPSTHFVDIAQGTSGTYGSDSVKPDSGSQAREDQQTDPIADRDYPATNLSIASLKDIPPTTSMVSNEFDLRSDVPMNKPTHKAESVVSHAISNVADSTYHIDEHPSSSETAQGVHSGTEEGTEISNPPWWHRFVCGWSRK